MTFGQQLQHAREARRWSMGDVARAACCDVSYISRLEADQRQPSRQIVEAVAAALGVPPAVQAQWLRAAGYWPGVARWEPPLEATP